MNESNNLFISPKDARFHFREKLLLLRLFRVGRLPSALYGATLLWRDGVPVLALEFGHLTEEKSRVLEVFPRRRWAAPLCRFAPLRLRAVLIWTVTLIRLIFGFLREGRPRFVVAHGLQEQCLARVLRLVFGVRYAVHVHEAFEYKDLSLTNKVFLFFEGVCLRGADFLIFPEKRRADIYQKRYRFTCPIHLAFNCPPLELPPTTAVPAELRKPPGLLRLLYVGGIGPNNALEFAVSALRELPQLELCLVGWAEALDEARLAIYAKELGVCKRVRFVGTVDEATKWALMRDSDIGYCVYEPTTIRLRHVATASNKFMESLAAGLPVITNNTESFCEVIREHEVGVTASELTAEGILGALRELACDTQKRKRFSENARRAHAVSFHYEKQFAPLRRLLGQLACPEATAKAPSVLPERAA